MIRIHLCTKYFSWVYFYRRPPMRLNTMFNSGKLETFTASMIDKAPPISKAHAKSSSWFNATVLNIVFLSVMIRWTFGNSSRRTLSFYITLRSDLTIITKAGIVIRIVTHCRNVKQKSGLLVKSKAHLYKSMVKLTWKSRRIRNLDHSLFVHISASLLRSRQKNQYWITSNKKTGNRS